jgi:hypothetical protein
MAGGIESLRASGNFASPRESGERPTREARRERGSAARESVSAPLPSPLPAAAGRGNRTVTDVATPGFHGRVKPFGALAGGRLDRRALVFQEQFVHSLGESP